MQWQHERRLVFAAGPAGKEWFCERCCWSRKLSESPVEQQALAGDIKALFDAHDCELFARENLKNMAESESA
jgi:hypothetical protein